MLALRCLALLFTPIKAKKLPESIPYIMKIVPVSVIWSMIALYSTHLLYPLPKALSVRMHAYFLQRGTPTAEATDKDNNQPHIVMLKDDDDEDTIMNQYFISVEQELMIESSNLMAAIFFTIAAHYIFNLSYHRKAGDLWLFIQEKILGLTSKAGTKRNPSSSVHFRWYTTCL